MLRAKGARREEPLAHEPGAGTDPERDAVLADAVGRALLVVLETLTPAERIAFVLHDTLAVPFAEIAPVLGRSPEATKKLAGRARRKVHGGRPTADPARHRRVIEAFLTAVREGDVPALLTVLAPDVVRHADAALLPAGAPRELRGARNVAEETRLLSRARARYAEPAVIDGRPGCVIAPDGRLAIALLFTIADDHITAYEVIAQPERLHALEISLL